MNVGMGPAELPEGVTPQEALYDFTKRANNHIDQAARAHADAVRRTVSDQQKTMLQGALRAVAILRRRAGR